jgi:hypothetical protein
VSMTRPPRCANECDSNLQEMNASKEKPRLGRGASPAATRMENLPRRGERDHYHTWQFKGWSCQIGNKPAPKRGQA